MSNRLKFYINGKWVDPLTTHRLGVVNPATEELIGEIAMGDADDVDQAVIAAKEAFETYSSVTKKERVALLERIIQGYEKRIDDLADTITKEMGAPSSLSSKAQVPAGLGHLKRALQVLENFKFEEDLGTSLLVHEPIGVCAFITPWNWPLNQIACKVGPALAAGCTMILKPSEVAPFSAILFTEILDEAGVPPGVFNLVNGAGPIVGAALAAHPSVDMVSFTGSTRAGVEVAKKAAPTVKRVTQELGGKSANIILDDEEFEKAIARGVFHVCNNSGQSCNAPTRMLVPDERMEEAAAIARATTEKVNVGPPDEDGTTIGPVVSEVQFKKIQDLIQQGIDEGAKLVVGGTGRPKELEKGYFVKPTVFSHVNNEMTIAREEIFGPVLVLIKYKDIDDAVQIANDTPYGLSGYISSADKERGQAVARRIRSGQIHLNGAYADNRAPFGGYKQSGNGREWGKYGFEEFLEVKAIFGYHEG